MVLLNKNDYKITRSGKPQTGGLNEEEKEALEVTMKRHKKAFEMLARGYYD